MHLEAVASSVASHRARRPAQRLPDAVQRGRAGSAGSAAAVGRRVVHRRVAAIAVGRATSSPMASDQPASATRAPAGARPAPSVDALHAAWARSRTAPRSRSSPRGEGCHVWDDARQALPRRPQRAVLREHRPRPHRRRAGGADQAERARLLHELVLRAPAGDRAGRAARRARARRPQPRVLHQRRQRGRRVDDQARPPVPQAHRQAQQDEAHRARDRLPRHLARARWPRPASPRLRQPFEPFTPGGCHVPNTNLYRLAPGLRRRDAGRGDRRADRVRGPRHRRRGDPRAGAERRRLLHAARGLLPARPRDLRRARRAAGLRRGHLLVGPPRRVVRRPALRLPARHHHDGEGPDLGLRADGRGASRPTASPSRSWRARTRSCTASRSAGTRCAARSRWRTSTSSSRRASSRTCASNEPRLPRDARRRCATSRSSATCAAPGYFHALELVKDQETKAALRAHEESESLLRGFLGPELFRRGLICRADDRGDPVVQLAPPLIAGPEQFEEIEAVAAARRSTEASREGMSRVRGTAMKIGVPTEIKTDEYRVALTPAGRARAGRPRPRGLRAGRRGRGLGHHRRRLRRPGRDDRPRRRRGLRRGRADRQGQGAPARRGRPPRAAPHALHLPAPRARPRADPGADRLRRDVHRLRDRRRTPRAGCRCSRR